MAIKIALAGNPNCGKTTMFNALTGANQYVGNWPGVTVEKKEGKCKENKDVIVTDLPGIYSLSPYTLEEVVSRDYLLKEKPEAIINLVDATNIERNLYLTTQLLELGIPVVIALNMADLLEKNKISIDTKALEKELGCKVVKTSALKGTGIREVVKEAVTAAKKESIVSGEIKFSKDTEAAVSEMEGQLPSSVLEEQKRWYAIKLLERDAKVLEQLKLTASVQNQVEKIAAKLEERLDDDTESIITNERYEAITYVVEKCVKKPKEKLSTSDKIDQIVTNRILGLPIFLGVMYVVYAIAVMTIGTYVTDWTNDVLVVAIQDAAASGLQAIGTAAFLEDLIVNGIIGGLGAVLGFLPQMAILFVLLSILEDCGYMVRVAFVMDRIFRKFGLSGKSFIPLLISSGCGIPGIMASKTIENDNDRRLTIMTLWCKASGYRFDGWCDRFRGDRISGRIPDIYHVRDWCCDSAGFRNYSEKDKTVPRRCGTVCNGASGIPPSTGEDSTAPYMGKTQRIYQKSRNDPAASLYRNVVPWRIWIYRWKLWGSRGFCRQYSGIHRKCDRSDLYTAWIWKMAAGGSFSFRILSKRSNRNDNGSSGKCSRRYRRPGSCSTRCRNMVPVSGSRIQFPTL